MASDVSIMTPVALNKNEVADEVWDRVVGKLTDENLETMRPIVQGILEERFKPQAEKMARSLGADQRFQRKVYDAALESAIAYLKEDEALQISIGTIVEDAIDEATGRLKAELTEVLVSKLKGALR